MTVIPGRETEDWTVSDWLSPGSSQPLSEVPTSYPKFHILAAGLEVPPKDRCLFHTLKAPEKALGKQVRAGTVFLPITMEEKIEA